MQPRIILVGQTFNQLTVLQFAGYRNNNSLWECLCTCGNTSIARGDHLRSGNTASCGCRPKKKRAPTVPVCHPDRAYRSKGLCGPCYEKGYRKRFRSQPHMVARQREAVWRTYGISFTAAEYDEMFASQGGVCAVCDSPPLPNRRLSVDHDHATGAVRGLLCGYCNRRLLVSRNTPEILSRAAEYLWTQRLARHNPPSEEIITINDSLAF